MVRSIDFLRCIVGATSGCGTASLAGWSSRGNAASALKGPTPSTDDPTPSAD